MLSITVSTTHFFGADAIDPVGLLAVICPLNTGLSDMLVIGLAFCSCTNFFQGFVIAYYVLYKASFIFCYR